ncbi:hypothetical protein Tco_0737663 [Tanacetum coccineum]
MSLHEAEGGGGGWAVRKVTTSIESWSPLESFARNQSVSFPQPLWEIGLSLWRLALAFSLLMQKSLDQMKKGGLGFSIFGVTPKKLPNLNSSRAGGLTKCRGRAEVCFEGVLKGHKRKILPLPGLSWNEDMSITGAYVPFVSNYQMEVHRCTLSHSVIPAEIACLSSPFDALWSSLAYNIGHSLQRPRLPPLHLQSLRKTENLPIKAPPLRMRPPSLLPTLRSHGSQSRATGRISLLRWAAVSRVYERLCLTQSIQKAVGSSPGFHPNAPICRGTKIVPFFVRYGSMYRRCFDIDRRPSSVLFWLHSAYISPTTGRTSVGRKEALASVRPSIAGIS